MRCLIGVNIAVVVMVVADYDVDFAGDPFFVVGDLDLHLECAKEASSESAKIKSEFNFKTFYYIIYKYVYEFYSF
jgi:hypothetical protein